MTRAERDRLDDIRVACEAIVSYAARSDVSDDLVFDAIRIRLVEIGEAVKDLGEPTRRLEPGIPWAEIARMRADGNLLVLDALRRGVTLFRR